MFIICNNDFPFLVCPASTGFALAQKIADHLRDECGEQLGLAISTYYHVQRAEIVSQELINQLKLENENGINETNHTEAPKIGSNNQDSESSDSEDSDGSTGKEL